MPVAGHRQVTDAYLVGLAKDNRGKVATFDRGLLSLVVPPGSLVELVQDL